MKFACINMFELRAGWEGVAVFNGLPFLPINNDGFLKGFRQGTKIMLFFYNLLSFFRKTFQLDAE